MFNPVARAFRKCSTSRGRAQLCVLVPNSPATGLSRSSDLRKMLIMLRPSLILRAPYSRLRIGGAVRRWAGANCYWHSIPPDAPDPARWHTYGNRRMMIGETASPCLMGTSSSFAQLTFGIAQVRQEFAGQSRRLARSTGTSDAVFRIFRHARRLNYSPKYA